MHQVNKNGKFCPHPKELERKWYNRLYPRGFVTTDLN